MCKKEIMGLTLEELQTELAGLGMKKFRAEQVFRWLYEKAATDFSQMSNSQNWIRALAPLRHLPTSVPNIPMI